MTAAGWCPERRTFRLITEQYVEDRDAAKDEGARQQIEPLVRRKVLVRVGVDERADESGRRVDEAIEEQLWPDLVPQTLRRPVAGLPLGRVLIVGQMHWPQVHEQLRSGTVRCAVRGCRRWTGVRGSGGGWWSGWRGGERHGRGRRHLGRADAPPPPRGRPL